MSFNSTTTLRRSGLVIIGFVWFGLASEAKTLGFIWLGIGIVYLAVITRGFKKIPPALQV